MSEDWRLTFWGAPVSDSLVYSFRFFLAICWWLFVSTSLVSAAPSPTPTPQIIFNRAVGDLAADPVRARIYATVPADNTVIVVDTNSMSVVATIHIGSAPQGLTISGDRSKLWVANSGSSNFAIGVIDLNTLQRLPSLSAPDLPRDIEEGAGHRLYLSRSSSYGGIMQINGDTGAYMTSFGTSFEGAFLETSPDRALLFVGSGGTLAKYNVATTTPSLVQEANNLGSNPTGFSVSHGGQFVVFPQGGGNGSPPYTTFEIPTANITSVNGSFNIGAYPGPAAFSNDDTLLYHSGYGDNRITIFSTSTFASLGTIDPGGDVSDLTIDRSGRWLFFGTADFQGGGDLRVLDTGRNDPGPTPLPTASPTPAGTPTPTPEPMPTGTPLTIFNQGVASLAADPMRSRIYGTVPDNNTVVVVDTASLSVIATIPIGSAPQGLSISADGSKLWVANSGSTNAAIGVVDLNTLQTLPSLPAPGHPYDIEEGMGNRLYLTPLENSFSGGIMQIDAVTGMLQDQFGGTQVYEGGFLEISPDRTTLFFANAGLSCATMNKFSVATANASLLQTEGFCGGNGTALRISRGGQYIVYPNGGGNGSGYSTYEIPTSNITSVNGTFVIGAYPGPAVFSNDDTLLYHGAYSPSRVTVFDTATFVPLRTIQVAGNSDITDLAVDRSGRWLFVATAQFPNGGDLRAFDTGRSDVVTAAQTVNLSTRMRVQTGDNVGIGGFIISGTASKNVLLRALGPSLTPFGVPDALPDPVVELHGPGGFITVVNDNWRDDSAQEALILATGIAPGNNLDSAIYATLSPGAYTAVLRGTNSTTGVALIEVYDLSAAASAKLANISTRAFVSTGNDIVIAGFILGNHNGNDRIVVRGIGPSLAAFEVPDVLANPTLELRNNDGVLLMANDDWQDNPAQAAELTAGGLAPADPLESGIAATLPPGLYTALLAGFNNGTGNGVVEVYDRGSP